MKKMIKSICIRTCVIMLGTFIASSLKLDTPWTIVVGMILGESVIPHLIEDKDASK